MAHTIASRLLAALGLACLLAVLAGVPAGAQDGPRRAAAARDAAAKLQTHLDATARTNQPLDLSAEPARGLVAQIFDLTAFTTLPPPKGEDVGWLVEWAGAAANSYQRLLYHRTSQGPGADLQVVERNLQSNEDQVIAATAFIVRLGGRMLTSVRLFLDALPAKTREEPARQQGYKQMVGGVAQTIDGSLSLLQAEIKPANARLLAQALQDTAPVWVPALPEAQRGQILNQLLDASAKAKDPAVADHLAAVRRTFSGAQ